MIDQSSSELDPLIELENVDFSYGSRRALRGVCFSVARGSVWALLGPNGGGKSTIFDLILGKRKPANGTVRLAGRRLADYGRPDLGRLVGIVPQNEAIAFGYSALEYVLVGRTPHIALMATPRPVDLDTARAALARCGVAHLANREVLEMSGGERRLVSLARAIAQDADLLLLDEPGAHLDVQNVRHLAAIIRDLRAGGSTVLIATHNPALAAMCADRLLLIDDGIVVGNGPTRELLTAEHLRRVFDHTLGVRRDSDGYWFRW